MLDFLMSLFKQLKDVETAGKYSFNISKIKKLERDLIYNFSRWPADYDGWSESVKIKRSFNKMSNDWGTPNITLLGQLSFFHREFSTLGSYYGHIEEQSNLWIVKPASNARGNGIFVTHKLTDIIKEEKSENVGKDTLVQKYLERPLLLDIEGARYKFDIRQWVLVTSLSPLTIYIFDGFYCRLCSRPFDLAQFDDISRHLTNYSLNKGNFKGSSAGQLNFSVLDDKFLKDYIWKVREESWEETLQPKISSLIVETLKACVKNMKPRDRSFEIYGFDILIDKDLNPHLLEVNLSPACEERETFLSDMLRDMTFSLFSILKEKEEQYYENLEEQIALTEEAQKNALKPIKFKNSNLVNSQISVGQPKGLSASSIVGAKKGGENKPSTLSALPRLHSIFTAIDSLDPLLQKPDSPGETYQPKYSFKQIYQSTEEGQLFLKSSPAYFEVCGQALNTKAEANFEKRLRQSYCAQKIQALFQGYIYRKKTKKMGEFSRQIYNLLETNIRQYFKQNQPNT